MRPLIVVTEPIHEAGLERLRQAADLVYLPERPGETLEQHLPAAEGVIVRIARLTAERLALAPRLRVIGKHGVGVDNIDLAACRARGITVVSTPGANDESVAEFTIMMLLMLARQVEQAIAAVRSGRFAAARGALRGWELQGRTLGVVGLGRIGARVAEIAHRCFGMRVLAYDPYVTAERAAAVGAELCVDLQAMLPHCDFLTIHVPLTPATRGLIGRDALARLKPGAYLVNCARGGIVDEVALVEALRSGHLAGAAVDVFADEPPPPDHPLLHLPTVIPTPHIAGQTEDSLRRMALLVADEVLRVLRGEPARYPVAETEG